MRPQLIVYIDTVATAAVEGIAAAAAQRKIATVLICPPGTHRVKRSSVARIVEVKDFSIHYLRRIMMTLDHDFDIRGVHSSFGPFRRDGFLHENVATLSKERGVPHSSPRALAAATNKFIGRMLMNSAGLPVVPCGLAKDKTTLLQETRRIGYPVILKPLTGVGSSLIYRCDNDSESLRNWRCALKQMRLGYYEQLRMAAHKIEITAGTVCDFDPLRAMLVESYLPGREVSVECLALKNRVIPLVVHDKVAVEEVPGVVLEHLLVAPPARFTAFEVRQISRQAVSAVKAFGLQNMLCHVELRWVDGAGPRVIEVNPRVGAGCVTDSIETFTNLNVNDLRLALILGEPIPRIRRTRAPMHAMVFLFAPHSGILTRLEGLENINRHPSVKAVRVMQSTGSPVGGDCEEGFLASIWMEVKNEKHARRLYKEFSKQVRIKVTRKGPR